MLSYYLVGDPPLQQAPDASSCASPIAARGLATRLRSPALYRCLMRHHPAQPWLNANLPVTARALARREHVAGQRYGIHGGLISPESRSMRAVPDLLDELIDQLSDDAAALGCCADLAACRTIITEGTSADMQLAMVRGGAGRATGRRPGLRRSWTSSASRRAPTASPGKRPPRLRRCGVIASAACGAVTTAVRLCKIYPLRTRSGERFILCRAVAYEWRSEPVPAAPFRCRQGRGALLLCWSAHGS